VLVLQTFTSVTRPASLSTFERPLSLPPSLSPGLSDTGRILSAAVSDGYLPGLLDHGLFGGMEDGKRILSPEETLMPPLSMQDRHPSAPQLVSMLATSVDNHKMSDMVEVDDSVSWEGFVG
jgi:hypothetical protein